MPERSKSTLPASVSCLQVDEPQGDLAWLQAGRREPLIGAAGHGNAGAVAHQALGHDLRDRPGRVIPDGDGNALATFKDRAERDCPELPRLPCRAYL